MNNPQQPDSAGKNGGTRHIIDHAISIPATHHDVWRVLSQLHHNPQWQTDCTSIAFITINRNGEGTRMRCTGVQGKEYVVEVTAWYERLGYEYIVVDGVPYGQNRGRIRLQEIAEGTIVQWSFSYELEGMFSGLRNNLGIKRNLDKHITESLRNLWRYMKDVSQQPDLEDVRSLMRDAPDVDQRATYEPRYPSLYEKFKVEGELQRTPSDYDEAVPSLSSMILNEPPLEQDDTRPNPIVQDDTPESVSADVSEKPIESLERFAAPEVTQEHSPIASTTPDVATVSEKTDNIIEETAPAAPDVLVDVSDTSQVSVFDIFGVSKPSESQQIKAVKLDEDVESVEAPAETISVNDEAQEKTASTSLSENRADPMEASSESSTDLSEKPVVDTDSTDSAIDDRAVVPEEPDEAGNTDDISATIEVNEPDGASITENTASAARQRQGLRRALRHQQQNLRLPD